MKCMLNGNPLQCSCLENPRDGVACGLPSMGSHRVRHDWSDLAAAAVQGTRGGRQPCGQKEARICEGSLGLWRHLPGHCQGRAWCVWSAERGKQVAGMNSKNKGKRRKENWRSRSRKSFLFVARSWNFRQSNRSLEWPERGDIIYITICMHFVDQRWEQWKQRGELGGVSGSGGERWWWLWYIHKLTTWHGVSSSHYM